MLGNASLNFGRFLVNLLTAQTVEVGIDDNSELQSIASPHSDNDHTAGHESELSEV